MAKRRYYVSLICLSLFIIACLLASFVISRSVGSGSGLDDSESQTGGQQLRLAGQQPPEEYELRGVQLVDLIECDKTFAYTKWTLSVRVPKTLPNYEQRPQFLVPDQSLEAHSSNDNRQQQQQVPVQPIQALTRLNSPSSTSTTEANSQDDDSESIEDQEESRFVLTSTNQFVAKAQNSQQDDQTNRTSGRSHRNARQSSEVASNKPIEVAPELPATDVDDPLRAAALDMNLSLTSINSTLTDCFIVDTEKRFNQKVALEDRHRHLANTRQVRFAKMMATIKACRLLTWATLTDRVIPLPDITGQPSSSSNGRQFAMVASPSSQSELAVAGPARNSSLRETVRPLERQPRPRTGGDTALADSNDFVNSLLSALMSPMPTQSARVAAASSQQPSHLPSPIPRQLAPRPPPPPVPARNPPARLVQQNPPPPPINSSSDEGDANRGSYINMGMSMVSGIVPNTLWCGLGDRAANYSELGAEFKVDSCCRAHDHCPIRLRPFGADYGLINWSMSTRSHCACDLDFSDCLTHVNTTLSNVIKTLYFRLVGLQCIDIEGRRLVTATATANDHMPLLDSQATN